MFQNYTDGAWCEGADAPANFPPSDTRDVIGEYARANGQQVEQAIASAHAASGRAAALPVQQRADALEFVAAEILARCHDLADLLSREEGKSLAEAPGEVVRAGHIFRYFAGEVLRQSGELLPSVRHGMAVEITREPVGVVAVITPWNFPIAIPAWKIAPALAYGNAVVFKPADLTPGSAWPLSEILSRAGLPSGVFNLVMGRGREVGDVLLNDPRVGAISFTGSESTGRRVAQSCVTRPNGVMAKFQLEMGGKNPLVVLADADLDTAVERALNGAFYSMGQRCTASSRLIVCDSVHDRFVDALATKTQALRVGDARSANTQIGPVVDEGQLEQDLEFITRAGADGARLVCGGTHQPVLDGQPGHFLTLALFVDTHNAMQINQEEVFGPVATVIRARDADDAFAIANDTRFGLSAGVVTTSLREAGRVKRELQAGMVMINAPTAGVDPHVPFGGRKGSSYGAREQCSYASDFYTTLKTTYLNP
ncbi:aldehyde dehydrogenase family protein [Paraburkholderia tropica]|uniref:aldehyde dehydrogenase family protein n=1 Tax=Paraburkholderia tropica TaxID=92647 RepID=UPI0030168655